MSNILLIETATHICSIGVAVNGVVVTLRESCEQRSHAEMITTFIKEVVHEAGLRYNEIDAVAVSKGPGSYTGLRIGVSTAKGICYALDKPLIAYDTLEAMSIGFLMENKDKIVSDDLLCPMLDARRMEVYTELFDSSGKRLHPVEAVIIDEDSYNDLLEEKRIWFFGDGASKCQQYLSNRKNANFVENLFPSVKYGAKICEESFQLNNFEDLAYFEPYYLKDFIAGIPKVKGLYS
ncbi:MAG: tRNA (adenosine(37)-N6)-threonylcarbamoyltransferase complex dimerization subunit type 1 TsaB [Bacteroidetes bacterium HGW-Bacteroidetes-1]|jgi:tRNA threonylcarbamoyladenosine biosynthesis protein TsaB|nr:MAG: tRNA (adenosine(37)-N6)-threonylcarbamoyltransferase complex dimerization subunit type 1 TsaB [Bacteroidetes bacterium HGW-Bacteroidetes-1]